MEKQEVNVQVTQDEHYRAFEWLETHLESKIYRFDIYDVVGMIEQVVIENPGIEKSWLGGKPVGIR